MRDRGALASKRLRPAAMIASLFAASTLVLASQVRQPAVDTSACTGTDAMKPARNFLLRDIDNRKWTFSSTKGKVVLIDFWATWCVPCKVEIPEFVDMYARYREQGLEVVGVSMDTDLGAIKSFAGEHKMNYPILIGAGADGVSRAWGVSGLPTTVVVARDGKICRKFVGQTAREQFEDVIKKLL
jgi:cytochrome c biogenesis protein CcmG/thiol:disulfide interchange protein DsbE